MSASDDLWRTPGAPVQSPDGGFYPTPGMQLGTYPVDPPAPTIDVRGEVTTGLITLLLCVLLGAPLGFIWAALRPTLDPLTVSEASESALKPQFTADLKLALIGLIAGALAGVAAWALVRRHGAGAAVGLALGGYAAMRVAAEIGKLAAHPDQLRAVTMAQLGPDEMLTGTAQQINDFLDLLSFHLRSGAVLYTFSIAAMLLFGVLTYARDRSSPAAEPAPGNNAGSRISWDSAAAG